MSKKNQLSDAVSDLIHETPKILPLLPLRGMLVFPYMSIPLDVGREKSINALEESMMGDRLIILAAQKQAKVNEPSPEEIYQVETLAEIKQLVKLTDGTIRILVEGLKRVRILDYIQVDPYYKVECSLMNEIEEKNFELEALMRTTISEFEQYVKLSKKVPPEIVVSISSIEEPGRLADDICSQMSLRVEDKQAILECESPKERLEKICSFLMKEMDILELERKIHVRVRKQMEKTQKEYYLREQIKAIQKELGEKDDRASEVEELREKLSSLKLPKEVAEKANKEIDRLEKMPPMAAEAVVVRNYLDWLLALPWNKKTKDRIDIKVAEEILDEDHYGLNKVKERIIEYLAVRQLQNKLKGPILCFIGPPGVGKTSLAKSIARSIERKFVRFSLGGVRDEAEIRGHRRTYVGAMPGKIIQAMRQAGSKNPVILLDEIDKMSSDFRGDPASALLEVLDPEQNNAFGDHYIEATYDLSDVMFITTANVLHSIPRPLLDRMEIITIPGYTEEEKMNIASKFLLPKQMKEHGLTDGDIKINPKALQEIIRRYTRESGVRTLERQIGTVCRKVVREIVQGAKKPVVVNASKLDKYLGIAPFRYGIAQQEDKVGVATGLAWTEVGGDVLAIEISAMKGKGRLTLTGKLGEVMRESAQAGFTYIRSKSFELKIDEEFYHKADIHVHVPEGGIPKDGPSAGITIATALASALTGRPVKCDVAMTGEITLTGRVLPIGGLKEKVLAAHRAGIKTIIIPEDNKNELDEIPQSVRKGLTFVPVSHMDEVLKIALSDEVVIDEPLFALKAAEEKPVSENTLTVAQDQDSFPMSGRTGLPA